MNNFFSSNLKFLRENKGWSKSDLAKKLNVHQSTVSRWENEEMGATVDNAYDVANLFNISVADLTGKDLKKQNIKEFNELEILFDKHKDILTDDDKDYIKFIIEKRKKEIDKELGKEWRRCYLWIDYQIGCDMF